MTALVRNRLFASAPGEASSRPTYSLPSAGFCVYQAGSRYAAIGMLTSHRADPSWT